MNFSSIPGLASVKSLLIDAVTSSHIAHAQLFLGMEGTLNLPLAIAFATYLHCEQKGEHDSCGTCPACVKNNKFIHPDTHFVFPLSNVKNDKDEDRFKAEMLKSWRAFLLEMPYGNLSDWTTYYGGEDKQSLISREGSRDIIKTLALKPFESKYKVMIIWQPELMHPSAANGILKILEEPAPNTFFILVTNAADRLLPTIVSRTQVVTVPLLDDADIERHLREHHQLDTARASAITAWAEGDLNYAIKLIDREVDDHSQQFTQWMRACFKKSYLSLVQLAEDFHALDKLSQKNRLKYGIHAMREALLYTSGGHTMVRSQGEESKFLQDFSKVMDLDKIEKSFTLMNDASYHLERNGSAKMIFLDLSLNMAKTINP